MTIDLFRRDQAAAYLRTFALRTTAASLATMATRGDGPPYMKIGRYPVYHRDDLLTWAKKRCTARLDSTSGDHSRGFDGLSEPIGDLEDELFVTGRRDFDEITELLNQEEAFRQAMDEATSHYRKDN